MAVRAAKRILVRTQDPSMSYSIHLNKTTLNMPLEQMQRKLGICLFDGSVVSLLAEETFHRPPVYIPVDVHQNISKERMKELLKAHDERFVAVDE